MARRRLQLCNEFAYGRRGLLRRGDHFRVSGGPFYVTEKGDKIPMYERGVLIFEQYCVQGSAKWIEAYRANGSGRVYLWVGRNCWSPTIPNLRRRPYRITAKVEDRAGKTARHRAAE